jgi:hypothetical protein
LSDREEIERIKHEELGPILPHARWDFKIDLGLSPDEVWKRIVDVVQRIAAHDYDTWPDDGYWRTTLPKWLSSFMMTEEEARAAMARLLRKDKPHVIFEPQ